MKRYAQVVFSAFLVSLCFTPVPAGAQPLGTFRWQLQPFCNLLTVVVTQNGAIYTLDGTDDRCGAAQQGSVVGVAFPNPDGSIGFGLTTVLAPGGVPVHINASISLATVSGTWRDSAGNNGTFAFTPGAGVPGLPVRPVSANGLPPSSITTALIAPAAVTASQIAPGTITTAQIAPATIAAFSPRYLRTEASPGAIDLDVSPQLCQTVDFGLLLAKCR